MNITAEKLQLFSTLLGAPEATSLELLESHSAQHPWLEVPVRELQETPLQQWQGEHTGLFINGYPHTVAPPFLSALRSGQMGGSEEEAMRDFYYRLGLEADDVPADYLGTMFECAAWLLQQEEQSDDFAELWDNYLYPVLPDFANRLIEHQGLRLYQEMGRQLSQLYWHNAPELALA